MTKTRDIVLGGIIIIAIALVVWWWTMTPLVNPHVRQAIALERIADALDRAFLKPAEMEPR